MKTPIKLLVALLLVLALSAVALPDRSYGRDLQRPLSEQEKNSFSHKARSFVRVSKNAQGLQTDLPLKEEPLPESKTPFRIDLPQPPLSMASTRFASFLLYAAIFVIVLVICVTLRDNLWSFSYSRPLVSGIERDVSAAAVSERMEKAQLRADDLAAEGDYAEAIHILLLQSMRELRLRLGLSIAASLTSREILSRVALPSQGRAVLADIISSVEVSYFGTHSPSADDYQVCREKFDVFVGTLAQGAVS